MRRTGKIDLTQGSIYPLIIRFALPLCLGGILQQMYSLVDTLVIGNFGGTTSIAAIGTSSQPIEILLCIFLGMGSGVSILVAQYEGSRSYDELKLTAQNAVSLLYCCAVPLTVLGILLGPQILRLMQVPDDTLPAAVAYIRIMFIGTIANIGYNINAGILRGLGDSKASLYFLVISCCINITLDLLFVACFRMDVSGAAIATVIAQVFSWVASYVYLNRKFPELSTPFVPRRFDRQVIARIARISLPLGFNNSFYSIGHIVMQLLINTQGSVFIAACSIASKITGMTNIALTSLASSATTFAGQNLGAKKYRRLCQGAWRLPLLSGALTLAMGLAVILFLPQILGLFSQDAQVIAFASTYVRVIISAFWAYAVFNTLMSFVNGMGLVRYSTIINILMLWIIRIPAAIIIVRFFDGHYVMMAISISFLFGMVCMLCYFLSSHWKNIRALAVLEQSKNNSDERNT